MYPALLFGGSIKLLYFDGVPSQKKLNWLKFKPLSFILKGSNGNSQIVTFTVIS